MCLQEHRAGKDSRLGWLKLSAGHGLEVGTTKGLCLSEGRGGGADGVRTMLWERAAAPGGGISGTRYVRRSPAKRLAMESSRGGGENTRSLGIRSGGQQAAGSLGWSGCRSIR